MSNSTTHRLRGVIKGTLCQACVSLRSFKLLTEIYEALTIGAQLEESVLVLAKQLRDVQHLREIKRTQGSQLCEIIEQMSIFVRSYLMRFGSAVSFALS